MKPKIILTLLTLMLCVSVFCVPALASAEPEAERLSVSTAWTDGDVLHIEVLDNQTGSASAIELKLSDYAENAQTITIQAVDADGNKSGVITITNPYYKAPVSDDGGEPKTAENAPLPDSESAVPDGSKPFTPDGTGGVVDNATEQDGKEFFTITTDNDNTFYLIVDRQKTGENVYLLNAVTENDLMALAAKGDGTTASAIPNPEPAPTTPTPTPEPTPDPVPETKNAGSNSSLIFIILAVVAVGGAGYYFKIVRPKQQAPDDYEDESDFEDNPDAPEDDETEEDTE